jgi:hypothetical protein
MTKTDDSKMQPILCGAANPNLNICSIHYENIIRRGTSKAGTHRYIGR